MGFGGKRRETRTCKNERSVRHKQVEDLFPRDLKGDLQPILRGRRTSEGGVWQHRKKEAMREGRGGGVSWKKKWGKQGSDPNRNSRK